MDKIAQSTLKTLAAEGIAEDLEQTCSGATDPYQIIQRLNLKTIATSRGAHGINGMLLVSRHDHRSYVIAGRSPLIYMI